jgi:HSP20 family protein
VAVNEKNSETEKTTEAAGRGALAEFREAVGKVFDSVASMAPDFSIGAEWPRHELVVEDEEYLVHVELPGFKRDEVEVSVAGRNLTVSGERKKFDPPAGARLLRSERRSGTFELSIRLPAEVDALSVIGQMHDGILEIKLPKASSRGRSIDIEETPSDAGATEVKRTSESRKKPAAEESTWEDSPVSDSGDEG